MELPGRKDDFCWRNFFAGPVAEPLDRVDAHGIRNGKTERLIVPFLFLWGCQESPDEARFKLGELGLRVHPRCLYCLQQIVTIKWPFNF